MRFLLLKDRQIFTRLFQSASRVTKPTRRINYDSSVVCAILSLSTQSMSSRLIEAKFRALDEAIEGMYKSKQVAPEAFRKAFSRHRNIHLNRLPNSTLNSTRADSQRPERPKSSSWSREGNLKVGGPASPLIESARNLPKRCTSAGQRKAIKNWFAPSSNNTPSMSSPIVKPKTVIEAFRSSELNDSITISHDHPISDPSFYHFEIRLDHPRNLQGWLFHGRFTDTSDPKKPTVELWNLEVLSK